METFNEDPKPGRLVLPLVLIGMIATTYTFINRVSTDNNLEIEPVVDDIVETIEIEPEEETTTTTTTTLPDEVVTYLEEISSEKIQSIDLATKVLEANDRWDNEEITYQEAKDEFAKFIEDAEQFVATVSEPGPPSTFANLVTSHDELKILEKSSNNLYLPSQIKRSYPSIEKISKLGWQPSISIKNGFERTVNSFLV